MKKVSNNKKICLIASSGGHLEQIRQLKKVTEKYQYYYVTNKTIATEKMKDKKYLVKDLYREKGKIKKIFRIINMFYEQLKIFLKEKPDLIVTTGAGIAIPSCLVAKFFGKKVIYIESFARIDSVNKSGKFIYKFADLFVVQWEALLKFYPKAVYWGWIY